MPLSGFLVKSWRSWADETRLELRALTLLFGNNSSGKSALLRFLPVMRDSTSGAFPGPLALASPALREARFEELMSHPEVAADPAPVVRLGLSWRRPEGLVSGAVTLRHLADQRRQLVEGAELTVDGTCKLSLDWQPPQAPEELRGAQTFRVVAGGTTADHMFDGARIPPRLASSASAEVRALLDTLEGVFVPLKDSVHWLSAIRHAPQRKATFPGSEPRRLGDDGAGADVRLAYDRLAGGGSLLARVSSWYERATGCALEAELEADRFWLSLRPSGSVARIPLVDTGEGMAQVLSVLVLLGMAAAGELGDEPILAVEHPELHLHPSAQRTLAMEFAAAAGSLPTARLVVETHSEHFLYGVQLAILRGVLTPDQALVYWVRQSDDGRSVLDRIELDEAARPLDGGLPPGLFSEGLDMAREIVLTRRERARR